MLPPRFPGLPPMECNTSRRLVNCETFLQQNYANENHTSDLREDTTMTLQFRTLRPAAIALAILAFAGIAGAQNVRVTAGFPNAGVAVGGSLQLPVAFHHDAAAIREAARIARARNITVPFVYQVWVPGYYKTITRQIWVEGCWRDVWMEPAFEWRIDGCGRLVRVCVRAGYWARVQDPGRFQTVTEQIWVAGHYETRCR